MGRRGLRAAHWWREYRESRSCPANVRRKEIATKLALGGSRLQVARLLLIESVILALAGGAGGVVFGAAVLRSLRAIGLDEIPRASEIHLTLAVILFALATSVAAGILIGLVPVAYLSRIKLSTVLREETRTGNGGIRQAAVNENSGLSRQRRRQPVIRGQTSKSPKFAHSIGPCSANFSTRIWVI